MTPRRKALAVVPALVVALTGLTAAPAAAHSGGYCGHGTTTHWGWWAWIPVKHEVRFVKSFRDPFTGRHTHEVVYHNGYGSYNDFYRC